MQQSKRSSLIESITNTAVGFIITMVFSPLIYWMCDVKINWHQMSFATILFTILSIARGYVVRRCFNKKQEVK